MGGTEHVYKPCGKRASANMMEQLEKKRQWTKPCTQFCVMELLEKGTTGKNMYRVLP